MLERLYDTLTKGIVTLFDIGVAVISFSATSVTLWSPVTSYAIYHQPP